MASSSAATSTPGTTKKVGGHCVVCGKETHLRCEACSRFGTDFMYFCGEEHQKLIWFLHKKVCGTRSNPFVFPGFVESEIQDILKKLVARSANAVTEQDSLRKKLEKWKEPIDTNLPQLELLKLREFAYSERKELSMAMGIVNMRELVAGILECPINHLVHSVASIEVPELLTQRSQFTSKFHHLHLVYVAVGVANLKASFNATQSPDVDVKYPSHQLRQFVFENLGPTQPEISSRIVGHFEGLRQRAVKRSAALKEQGKDLLTSEIRLEEFGSKR
ncbi:hypothetical protein JCM5350_000723 [Sporobolomyces pararoseus]